MYIYNIAVRWKNGDLEGFGASALERETAYKRAVNKAHQKAASFSGDCGFDVLTKEQYQALSIDEQDSLQADWDSEKL